MNEENGNRYMPLDGNEMLEYLLYEVRRQLKPYGEFGVHNAYHNPKIRFAVIIEQRTPGEGTHIEHETKISIEDVPIVFEPDKVRDLLGIGRYKVVESGGVLVDEKEEVEEKEVIKGTSEHPPVWKVGSKLKSGRKSKLTLSEPKEA